MVKNLKNNNDNDNEIKYSIVIPVYNSSKSIEILTKKIISVFKKITTDYEIILIDDCSKDNSWKILKKLNSKNKKIKIIQLMKNFGQHNALMCGYNNAKGNYIISMDDDLQHPPEEIPRLIRKIKSNNYDAIIGKPKSKKHSLLKNLGSNILNNLYSIILNKPKNIKVGSFCIFSKFIIQKMITDKTPNPMTNALLFKNTNNVANLIIDHKKRKYGKTNYNLSRHIKIAYDLIINYSTIPLKIVSIIGIFFSLISFLGLIYIFYRALIGNIGLVGWASTILLVSFFGGMTLLSFGIVGEYLIRILQEASNQKQYITRKKK
jgi:polyisoprenyl-phosphate glycosyltransferase